MTFDEIMSIILHRRIEGGDQIVENPRDPGGLTKWGISLRANPELGRDGIINLTKEKALKIYRKNYWQPASITKYPSMLRLAIMDGSVNHGVRRHNEIVQQAANSLGSKLVVDGLVGPKTLAAIKGFDKVDFLVALLETRMRVYQQSDNFDEFGRGWIRRLLLIAIQTQ
jgi:lysozyme family protein